MPRRARHAQPNVLPRQLQSLRHALRVLAEDPPLALGATRYAQTLLPAVPDMLQRGMMLRRCLRSAIAALRPNRLAARDPHRVWAHQIHTLEFVEGLPRAEIMRRLAISYATYGRAKRRGLDQIATLAPRFAIAAQVAARAYGRNPLRLQPADVIAATLCGCAITDIDRADGDRLTVFLDEPRMGPLRLICGGARLLLPIRSDGKLLRLPVWQRTIQWADWPWPDRLRLTLADGYELAVSVREAEIVAEPRRAS